MREPAANLKEPFVGGGTDDRSPLEILNEKLLRLGALSQEGEATMPAAPSLERVESRFTALLETLVARSAQAEERSADMLDAVSRATEATDQKVTEALRSISACMEAVERAPRISLHLIRTVSTRLDQIEERLPHVHEAVLNPIRVAIESLESRLDALRLSPEAANHAGIASLSSVEAKLESILAQVSKLEPSAKRQASEAARHERQTEAVGELARKLDAIESANRDFASSMDARFADLGDKVPPNAIPAIRDQIDVLTREIGGWRAGPSDAVIADLRRDIADVAKAVASSAPGPVLSGLEAKIVALGEKIDATREAGVSDVALAPLKKMLADVTRRIQAIKPVTLDGVEAELRTLSRRLDRPATPSVDPAMIEALGARLEAVHGLMLSQGHQVETIRRFVDAGGPPPPDLGTLTTGLATLTLQVEGLAKTIEAGRNKPLDKSFSALGTQLGEARQEIAELRRIIDTQAQVIADLSGKLADVHRATVPVEPEAGAMASPQESVSDSENPSDHGTDSVLPDNTAAAQEPPVPAEPRPASSGPKLRLRTSQAVAA